MSTQSFTQHPNEARPVGLISAQPSVKPLTGSQILLQCLVEQGVDTVFGLPGGVILPIYDVLPDYPLNHILVRHEQGATHMAEGYARATGRPGVVLVTSGPGATNVLTGVADAYYDSVPMVVITGNVPSGLLGNDAFQEADIVSMTRPCTKHNSMVRDVKDVPQAIKEAFYIATTGRPGPVLIDIPKDVLMAAYEQPALDYASVAIDLPGYQPQQVISAETQSQLSEALSLLQQAKQPVMLVGGGLVTSTAHTQAIALSEKLHIPVASTLMGLGAFPSDHPNFIGFSGMHGHYWVNIAIAHADVLLVVGSRLGDRQTGKTDRFASHAKIIHLDLDPTTLCRNVQATLPIQGDVSLLLDQLNASAQLGPSANHTDWFAQLQTWQARRAKTVRPEGLLTPQFVIEELFRLMPRDGFVTTEVGQHQMWTAQRYNLSAPRSFITSGGLGTMGFGFPAAIGVAAAFPNRTVVDVAGDGSFQMTLQELATAVDQKLPVKVCIINNGHLGMIRQWQGKMYSRVHQARMTSPDYVKLAEAYGAAGFLVTHPNEVEATLQQAFAITDRPVLIDFRVLEETDVYPWVPAGAGNDQMLEEIKLEETKPESEPA